MANLISPAQINYGMDPNLALALQQRASTAGNIPQALGQAIGTPIQALGQQYEQAQSKQMALEQQEQQRALMMQAAQGAPGAKEQLFSIDPKAALQLQESEESQAKQQQAAVKASQEQEDRERRKVGRLGNLISASVGNNKRETVKQFYDYVSTIEDGDPRLFGIESRDAIDAMSIDQLNKIGKMARDVAIDPAEVEKLSLKGREVSLKEREAEKVKTDLTTLQKDLIAAGIRPGTKEFRDAILAAKKSGTVVNIGKQSEGQRKDEFMASTANSALNEIKHSLGTKEFDPTSISTRIVDKFGTIGNFAKSPEWQIFEGANDAIIEMYLNKTTGAAYNDLQLKSAKQYLKVGPGDAEKTVKTKLKRIDNLVNRLNKSAGVTTQADQEQMLQPAEEVDGLSGMSDAELMQLLGTQ